MSDEEVQTKKGRKAAVEATKRSKKDAKAEVEDAPPVKRGRGRPKGTAKKPEKKETKAKANGVSSRRGRKKKEEKEESAEEENGDKSSENEEEEDDE
ncbi:unnamed protein product [Psylliodes chrysocephalus]|uniref:BZIP domain-containing protein n=1 Tax=Psylliodes chrysocephalus TaxID=3402493 RepID=A0A9P0GA33_9CUCU|nr:unnamed protein product [Psylliodes chrysocephala]